MKDRDSQFNPGLFFYTAAGVYFPRQPHKESTVPVYRVHFTWNEKKFILKADSLDLTHPYFVSIKELLLPEKGSLLVNVEDDELRSRFGSTSHLMIPFQSVSMIEEFKEDPDTKPLPGTQVVVLNKEKENNNE